MSRDSVQMIIIFYRQSLGVLVQEFLVEVNTQQWKDRSWKIQIISHIVFALDFRL